MSAEVVDGERELLAAASGRSRSRHPVQPPRLRNCEASHVRPGHCAAAACVAGAPLLAYNLHLPLIVALIALLSLCLFRSTVDLQFHFAVV